MLIKPFTKYLSKLNHDDDALKQFLADPIGEADAHGLSKAERAVLRRVVAMGSNGSVNGYSIVKPLAGYRQAVQMMQNVMHSNMGAVAAASAEAQHTMLVYIPTSADPYGAVQSFTGNGDTIGALMDDIVASYGPERFDYTPTGGAVVDTITVNGHVIDAPPTNKAGVPFWFWSVDGKASPNTIHGTGAEKSYRDFSLDGLNTVVWQVIAPTQRGFPACDLSDGAHTAGLV